MCSNKAFLFFSFYKNRQWAGLDKLFPSTKGRELIFLFILRSESEKDKISTPPPPPPTAQQSCQHRPAICMYPSYYC